ncbi:MAG: FAD-dependent oxidoreductase [Candidatus Omnitrophica bacterium]|nr:FAD-dependent oxidoreductase [Candidatus Omnitrophota bacterium]
MKLNFDALIIGAGPAGLGAALSLKENGIDDILIVDREDSPGGILLQCIHNGFGLHRFKEELTGPEYAERDINLVRERNIDILLNTCALDIISEENHKTVVLLSEDKGLLRAKAKVVILAMGCRERNRGNIAIPGARPAGILTAGFAQKMMNMLGHPPGNEIVILGSGDIGLIMARRLSWEGARVKAVIEAQAYPGGLNRNIVQCLHDFDIPLYLSHTISNILGAKRIESVEVAPLDHGVPAKPEGRFSLACDTLLLSVGLIPENELSLKAGVILDPATRGAVVDANLMTSVEGIFACGNVLQVHDLADNVSEEAACCGKSAARYLVGERVKKREIPLKTGNLVRYVLPACAEVGKEVIVSFRPISPAQNVTLVIKTDTEELLRKKERKIFPSIMHRINLKQIPENAAYLEVSFVSEEK